MPRCYGFICRPLTNNCIARAITHKEGMRSSHREIIHHLVGGFKHNGLDYAGCAIGLLDVVTRLQFTGWGPTALRFAGSEPGGGCHCVEGMLRRGLERLGS